METSVLLKIWNLALKFWYLMGTVIFMNQILLKELDSNANVMIVLLTKESRKRDHYTRKRIYMQRCKLSSISVEAQKCTNKYLPVLSVKNMHQFG